MAALDVVPDAGGGVSLLAFVERHMVFTVIVLFIASATVIAAFGAIAEGLRGRKGGA